MVFLPNQMVAITFRTDCTNILHPNFTVGIDILLNTEHLIVWIFASLVLPYESILLAPYFGDTNEKFLCCNIDHKKLGH